MIFLKKKFCDSSVIMALVLWFQDFIKILKKLLTLFLNSVKVIFVAALIQHNRQAANTVTERVSEL